MARSSNLLVTLAFSHYNEKARWALDHCGIEYEERRYMPIFSQLGVMIATHGRGGRSDAVSSRWSTPVLLTRDGKTLSDSTDIARWASAESGIDLFPTPEVAELVDAYGKDLGPHTRRVAYFFLLGQKDAMRTLVFENVSKRQALAYHALSGIGGALIKKGLGVNDARTRRSIEKIHAELKKAEKRLEHTRYLAGDRFTAADLTFASLLGPVLGINRADGYGATLPTGDQLTEEARGLIAEVRESRAGAFAIDVFRKHRRKGS